MSENDPGIPITQKNWDWLLWLFAGLTLLNLWAEFQFNQTLIYLSKPALVSTLSLYFFLNTRQLINAGSLTRPTIHFSRWILAGLIFSLGGDILLMFVETGGAAATFFLAGLGSFLLAHLCYLKGFLSYRSSEPGFLRKAPIWFLIFGLYLIGNVLFLWPDLPGAMKIPVALYSAAIMAMALSCLNLKTRLPDPIFTPLMIGVLLFIFSDSLIALGKFKDHVIEIPLLRVWIMLTYLLSQYLICTRSLSVLKLDRTLVAQSPDGYQ